MPISDDDLVRQLESVPLVESPDFRDAVMARVRRSGAPAGSARTKSRRYVLGLAWAAAVAIVIGVTLQRTSEPRNQNAAATIVAAPAEISIHRNGDRWTVQPNVEGEIEWDRSKLSEVAILPNGTVILQRRPGASGRAEIELKVSGKEVVKTSVAVN